MADDQATLGRFAAEEAEQADDGDEDTASEAEDGPADRERTTGTGELGPVCPWCLAPAGAFETGGPTGASCSRCSAALPVDADWFLAGEVVARRPMYGDERE